jgi:hypothetical protein
MPRNPLLGIMIPFPPIVRDGIGLGITTNNDSSITGPEIRNTESDIYKELRVMLLTVAAET